VTSEQKKQQGREGAQNDMAYRITIEFLEGLFHLNQI